MFNTTTREGMRRQTVLVQSRRMKDYVNDYINPETEHPLLRQVVDGKSK